MKKPKIILIHFLIFSTMVSAQKTSFQGLGDLPGGTFGSSAQGISADGKVIIGFGTTSSGEEAFRWTEETGMVSLGNLPDKSFKNSWANKVSDNGNVIVGYGDPIGQGWNTYKGFVWTSSEGMREIGMLDTSSRSMAFCVSGDGKVIAGDGGPVAFKYTGKSKTERLGVLPGRTHSRVVDMSADGKVMIGQSYSLPKWDDEDGFMMKEDGTMQSMSSLTGGMYCMVLCLSPDGSVITGTTSSSPSSFPAFFWTKDKGFVNIGHLSERNTTHPGDMTTYGKIIVGGSFSGPDNGDAFIWDSIHGMRNLQALLEKEFGLELKGWKLQNASGITPDGNVIVGGGINPQGNKEGFRVILDTTLTNVHSALDYYGQSPPQDTPIRFQALPSGSSLLLHSIPSFSPSGDESFFATIPDFNTYTQSIYYRKKENGHWLDPVKVSFSNGTYSDKLPCFSGDGKRVYFTSDRPLTGSGNPIDENIWYIEKNVAGWSDPICLDNSVNSSQHEGWITVAANNNLYFCRDNKLYLATWQDDHYLPAQALPIYTSASGVLGTIAPDENYYIVQSAYVKDSSGSWIDDLFILVKTKGVWGTPIKLDSKINAMKSKSFAKISPDGKYLFFLGDNNDAYWVSTKIIDKLRNEQVK